MAKTQVEDMAIVLSADSRGLAAGLRQAEKELAKFRQSVEKSQAPPRASTVQPPPWIGKHAKSHRELKASMREAELGVGSFINKVAAVGGGMLAAELGIQGVAGALNFLKESVRDAAEFEQTEMAFGVMLKSAAEAKTMLAGIRQFAASTPFGNTELTDASRKLLAYGITADQILPTLRMLGDVAAATQTPVNDLAYLYGTLAAQGRAYTKDIYQFANRGIPIWDELARSMNKSVGEVQQMVEEGKVGFPQVIRAFKSMTAEGGRYHGMTERLADSTAGALEVAGDAWKQAKLYFGRILIEELGIKEAARDFDGFMKSVQGGMDRIRPAVRLTGDLLRGAGQAANEFGRVLVEAVDAGGGAFGRAFPGAVERAREFLQLIRSAKDFKLDEEQVVRYGAILARSLVDSFVYASKSAAQFGVLMKTAIVDPLLDGLDDVRQTFALILKTYNTLNDALGNGRLLVQQIPQTAIDLLSGDHRKHFHDRLSADEYNAGLQYAKQAQFYVPPPRLLDDDDQIVKTAKRLWAARNEAERLFKAGEISAAEYRARIANEQEYLSYFSDLEEGSRHQLVVQGLVPRMRVQDKLGPWSQADREQRHLERERADLERQKRERGPLRVALDRGEAEARAYIADGDAGAKWKAQIDQLEASRIAEIQFRKAEQAERERVLAELGAIGRLFEAARQGLERRVAAVDERGIPPDLPAAAAFGAPSVYSPGARRVALEKERPELIDRARQLRDEFGPSFPRIQREFDDLKRMVEAGIVSPFVADRQFREFVAREAERRGVGQPSQLPDAALRDSAEAARLITMWRAGSGAQTTEDLLRRLVELDGQQSGFLRKLVELAMNEDRLQFLRLR